MPVGIESGVSHGRLIGQWVALALLLVAGAWLAAPGLDPPSLWNDDVWVAIYAKHGDLESFLRPNRSTPAGFLALSALALRTFGDPELSLQRLPFLSYLVMIGLVALLVRRVTGKLALGLAGGALCALNPIVLQQAVAVKQYTGDAVATLLLLLFLGLPAEEWSARRVALGCALLPLLMLGSSVLLLALVPLAVAAVLSPWIEGRRPGRPALAGLAAALGLGALHYLLLLRHQSSPDLVQFWVREQVFFDRGGLGSALSGAVRMYGDIFLRAFPAGTALFLVPFVPIGWVALFRQPHRRALAWGLLLFYGAMLPCNLLRLYPFGGGRLDLFHFSLTILLALAGLQYAGRRLALRAGARRWSGPWEPPASPSP